MSRNDTFVIHITDKAAEKMNAFLDGEYSGTELRDEAGIKVRVILAGCTGFRYLLESFPACGNNENLEVIESNGVKILVESDSKQYLNRATLDYVCTENECGYSFENPNSPGCENNCGISSSDFSPDRT